MTKDSGSSETQDATSRFLLDNGDAQARLLVDSASLSGSLDVLTSPTYDPDLNELVELITLNDDNSNETIISGQFDDISLPTTLSGKAFELSITSQGVFLDPYLLGDFNDDDLRNAIDIDLLSTIGVELDDVRFDLNGDNVVDESDRVVWIEGYERTYFGDSNLDGEFDSADFVQVFQRGKYENGLAGWADGDWTGDGYFDSEDFVLAFQSDGYEKGPRPIPQQAALVPEPVSHAPILVVLFSVVFVRAKNRRMSSRRMP